MTQNSSYDEDVKAEPAHTAADASVVDTAPVAAAPAPVAGEKPSAIPLEELTRLSNEIVDALKTVFDPEIPADIYELGLIYKVELKDDRSVDLLMTLTTPNCPAAGELPQMVENAVACVPGVGVVNVNLVWDPAWTPDRMSDEARLVLNMW